MLSVIKEFCGIGGYTREAAGAYSWQHLTFVSTCVVIMFVLGIFIGLHFKKHPEKNKNLPLIWAALLIDGFEIGKIIICCIRAEMGDAHWYNSLLLDLPLFLCSIQLITLPLAAFTKGRLKEAALDFVLIFGLLGALAGTFGAAQNFGSYPLICIDNVASVITHCISGFGALYIGCSGMASLRKRNIGITYGILGFFCIAAYAVNRIIDYNYMFLMRGDGTPYDILFNLVGGNQILYPLGVVGLFLVYIFAFYMVHFLIKRTKKSDTVIAQSI
jgi:uncharacterized membrane protein YwaF